jgi:putative cell wall-binding protein
LRTSVKRFSKSLSAGVVAGALAVSGLAVALTTAATPAAAATSSRVGGANRYDTARLAALANFPAGSATAVLASGENFPDGLASADLAGSLGAPLLLTPKAALAAETVAALATLHVHTVDVVGGTAAVSAAVIAQLQGLGYTVPAAVAGADRYATASAVATAATGSALVGTVGGRKTAILATGANFPDALSAGGASYFSHLPILLTDPAALSASASASITALGITNVIIMGGTTAVSAAVETAVKALVVGGVTVTTTREAGADRFATATAMAALETTPIVTGGLGMSLANVVFASGLNFPDALVGAEFKSPIVLDDPLPPATATYLGAVGASIGNLLALGGLAVIPAADLTAALAAIAPSAGTATIAAVAGGTSFTVTFSATVAITPGAAAAAAFTLNNAALAGGSAVAQTGPTSYLVTLGGGTVLKAGDVIALSMNPSILNAAGQAVAFASFTVPAAAAPALVSDLFFVTTTPGATAINLVFSKPVKATTITAATVLLANNAGGGTITFGGAVFSADGTSVMLPVTAPGILANATLQVTAGVTDLGVPALPLSNPQTTTAQANGVPPFIASGIQSVVAVTHGFVSTGYGASPSNITVTAKTGGPADGALGGLYKIQWVAPNATTSTTVTALAPVAGVTTFQLSAPVAGTITTGAGLAAALNANSTFSTFFVANGTGTGDDASTVPLVAATLLGGGTTTYAVTAVLSKQVLPAAALTTPASWTVSNPSVGATSNITGAGVIGNFSLNNAAGPSTVSFTATATTPAQVVVHGTSTLGYGPALTDFAGNSAVPAVVTL